ncbi:MAG: hypothetical protein C4537_05045 [Acholeplasma sp.]|nr:MAG: hypothetical protein C4537_05045 [Acholeplasma sp.]
MKKLFSLLLLVVLAVSLAACGEEIAYLPVDEFTDQIGGIQDSLDGIQDSLDDFLPRDEYVPYTPVLSDYLEDEARKLSLPASTVTSDIVLPTLSDIVIVWQSSHPEYVNATGKVNQPSFTTGDVEVILTALLFKDGQVTAKNFTLTVPALPESDQEKVAGAINSIGDILEEDIINESVDLPTMANGANIQWETTSPSYFSATGQVLRPHFDQSNATVVLTAYVSAGKVFQMYKKTVTVEKMPYKQYGMLASGPFQAANVNATMGAPLTFKLVTQEGYEIYIPYSNVNAENILISSPYPMVYTPAFEGTQVPLAVNNLGVVAGSDWGVAFTIVDGVIDTIYDGIGKKIFNAENPAGIALAAGTTYLTNIPIPENGYVVVFHNSAASIGNTLNGREFGRNVLGVNTAALGKTLTMEGLTLDATGIQLTGGVFWRGFVDVTLPFEYINPAPWKMWVDYATTAMTTSNFAFFQSLSITSDELAPAADGSNVIGAYPLLFTAAYFDAFGGTAINTGQGYTLAAVMSPEAEKTQIIQVQEEDRELILQNEYEIYRVYDGIGGSIKTKNAAQVTLAGGDSGKNMAIARDQFLAFWANNGVDYASDTHNRRIAADYFYAIDNWVWGVQVITEDDMLAAGYRKFLFVDIFDQFEFVE